MTIIRSATLALLLFCALPLEAQLIRAVGVKAGLSLANEKYKFKQIPIDPDPQRRTGWCASVFVEWLDLPSFSISTELMYTQKGMGMIFNETGPDGPEVIRTFTVDNRLDYLSLPILAKIIMPTPVVSPYLLAGPRFDILLGYSSDNHAFDLLYDQFKSSTAGGTVGVGVNLKPLFPLLAEARYNWDLTDSFNISTLEVSNNTFDLLVGLTF